MAIYRQLKFWFGLSLPLMTKLILIAILLQGLQVCAQSVIQSPECSGVIRGKVLDPAGLPVTGITVVAWPLGVDLGAILPQMTTDETGAFRVEHVCPGRYAVVVEDKKAGYPHSSPEMFAFLYGHRAPEGKLTPKRSTLDLLLYFPPKPGLMTVSVRNSEAGGNPLKFSVKITVPHQRRVREVSYEFKADVANREIPIPPDKDVILHVTAEGFQEWRESAGHGKVARVPSGTQVAVEVPLVPLKVNE